ncbi:hypothetical protein ASZ90_019116 [hydrocarbon metagenome]|uniref:DUF2007 domain-containing protein n=1 Tax=hydrocarbon metagenome TaxID=938273 RepID=A0A0W8E4A6_9ZZZZ
MIMKGSNDSWQLIANVRDHIEAGMIKSLLNEAGITVLEKSKGSGAYMEIYMGISPGGIDLYVPAGQFGKAAQLLGQETKEQVYKDEAVSADHYNKLTMRKRLFSNIYLVVMILGLIVVLISGVLDLLATG